MSLPKEPRQLMINLMYIVLTAMLALNVSAEILNAFLTMDKSISESSRIVGDSNGKLFNAIAQQADAYSQYEPYKEKAEQAQDLTKTFYEYVGELKEELITISGGYDEEGKLKGMKRKEPTTDLFLNEGKGDILENKINEVRTAMLNLIENESERDFLSKVLPLELQPIPEDSDKDTWAQFTFQQMPVAAVLPILTKFQNDAKIAESALLGHFYNKVNTATTIILDEYMAVVSADKSYVIRGEEISADIFLSAFSSTADNITVKVDGKRLNVRDGKALFKIRPNEIGKKSFDAVVEIKDPITNEIKSYRKKFIYEVGERSVAVSADKMNVFYLGVDNPLSVSAAGVPSDQVKVNGEGVKLTKLSNGKYNVKPLRAGNAKIVVSGGGLDATTFEYRVKRIPDPVVHINKTKTETMSVSEFKAYRGLIPFLENFDFKARCKVAGFEISRVPKRGNAEFAKNSGGSYTSSTQAIINNARRGDTYYFDLVKGKCPGDEFGRKLNGFSVRIK